LSDNYSFQTITGNIIITKLKKGALRLTDKDKLTINDEIELTIEAGISSIPYIGGALQTLYYGRKNEKRFKRVEKFYKELYIEIESVKDQLPSIKETNRSDEALGILETINDEIETASSQTKIDYYKKAYKNVLLNFNNNSFDNEKFFVRLLPDLTDLEINILFNSNHNPNRDVHENDFYNNNKNNINLIEGSLNRLVNFGLIEIKFGTLISGGRGSEIQQDYSVSDLGSKFISFIFN
jgi:hypothetical protein